MLSLSWCLWLISLFAKSEAKQTNVPILLLNAPIFFMNALDERFVVVVVVVVVGGNLETSFSLMLMIVFRLKYAFKINQSPTFNYQKSIYFLMPSVDLRFCLKITSTGMFANAFIIRCRKIIKTPTTCWTNYSSHQILAGLAEFVFDVIAFQGGGRSDVWKIRNLFVQQRKIGERYFNNVNCSKHVLCGSMYSPRHSFGKSSVAYYLIGK